MFGSRSLTEGERWPQLSGQGCRRQTYWRRSRDGTHLVEGRRVGGEAVF